MRLPKVLAENIIQEVRREFTDSDIYLFASRCNDTKRGGDVDIAIKTSVEKAEFRRRVGKILYALEQRDFPLPLDLVQWNADSSPVLRKELEAEALRLG